MKIPVPNGTRAVSCLMGANSFGRKTIISLALLLVLQVPGLSQQSTVQLQNSRPAASTKAPSRDDILIVELSEGVDRDQFDQLLQEVHGTFLRTIEVGPTLKFQVILTEPGEAAAVAKRLSGDKEIARVQRNTIYRIKNDIVAEHAGGGAHLRPIRSKIRLGHGGSGHSHGSAPVSSAATPPPVIYSAPLSGNSNDPYFS